LAPSDEMGMRFVYPAGKHPVYCVPPSQQIGPAITITQIDKSERVCGQQGGASWIAALALLWLRSKRRRPA
jgi:hypothetical protein